MRKGSGMGGKEGLVTSREAGGEGDVKTPLLEAPVSWAGSLLEVTTVNSVLGYALGSAQWLLDVVTRDTCENKFLSGNFAPVMEGTAVVRGLRVSGSIPEYLRGEFVRVGPNPKYRPTSGYHWFDGDGMVHAVKISPGGEASYVNRFVETSKLRQEDRYGKAMFLKLGEFRGVLGLIRLLLEKFRFALKLLDPSEGLGTANTAVVFHGGSLLVLQEADKPYAVRLLEDGDLETLGRVDYGGALDHPMTAHPKLDPVTGELFGFGYDTEKAPYLKYCVVGRDGKMGAQVPITLPEPVMMHDFAITERYAVFADGPLVLDPKALVVKGTLPFVWKGGSRPMRFGILPRYDTTEAAIRWFTTPACFIFHIANAWEEDDVVRMFACRYDEMSLDFRAGKMSPILTEFRFDLKIGGTSEITICDIPCEFPRINEAFVGRKQRFVYVAVLDELSEIGGVAKIDLSLKPVLLSSVFPTSTAIALASCDTGGCAVGYFSHGRGRLGSEPVFVPRPGASPLSTEDDGCLLNMVFDSKTHLSEVVIVDAKTMSATPLAVIHLQSRVPFGFHGTFVSEEELRQQQQKK